MQPARVYHHTGPVNTMYGLREGLAMLAEEGLEKCWRRHADCAEKLHQGRSIAEAAGINGRSFRATIKFMGPCLFPGCRRTVAADNFQLASGKS